MASVMLAADEVTVFCNVSSTRIWTLGVIAAPAVTVLGCTANTSFAAPPALMANVLLVALVRPLAVAVRLYAAATLSIVRSLKLATPWTAARVSVPLRRAAALPVPGVIATVIAVVAVVSTRPWASCTATVTLGASEVPALDALGWTTNANFTG